MIGFSKIELENKLKVIHHYDASTPFIIVNVLYQIGAKDEDENKTGFAHLFEHLMFGGTKLFPNFDHPLQDAGGENNAFTNNDYTNYYDVVPKENIETALCLEADRMQSLDINEQSLKVQKDVVCEEFKEHYVNQPYGDAWHLLRALVYEQHPYKWPTIGKNLKQIEEATLQDVRDFYAAYYTPSNAILVISGNIEQEKAFSLTEKYFGQLTSKVVQHKIFSEPEQQTAKTQTTYNDVPLNAIYIAFKITDKKNKDYYTADTITDILSTGTSSRLYQNLVKKEKAFIEIDAYITGSNDVGMFVIEGKIAEDCTVERAESLIWNEIEQLQKELISVKELQKIKNKMLTYMAFSESSLMNRTVALAHFELLGDANQINKEIEAYENVSAEAIQTFANVYLNKSRSNTLYYLKQQ
ncbi:MAG: insulinase family protein [Bacteroidetes bacterium]|nr:insulinase family protein [Bacteroidota bacterium]MCB0513229.1 insulinase family protein [Bacteroidota bacterium]